MGPPLTSFERTMKWQAPGWGALLCSWSVSCGASLGAHDSECDTGTLGCACYGNWSCNYQLSCVDDVCVDRRDRGPEAAVGPHQSHLQSLPDPLAAATSDDCVTCLHDECSHRLEACYAETGCIAVQACIFQCIDDALPEASCRSECSSGASSEAQAKAARLSLCANERCGACGQSD